MTVSARIWRQAAGARPAGEALRYGRLAVVAPFYNEGTHVREFLSRLTAVLADIDAEWSIVCVNDGSADDTILHLVAAHDRDPRIKVIDLSRNFGKDYALTAGLDHCRSDAVVPTADSSS